LSTVILDIEANSLNLPTNIWVCVCKDIDTGKMDIFRDLTTNEEEGRRFTTFLSGVDRLVGHALLSYDVPVLERLLKIRYEGAFTDTLIISKLVDYSRPDGHSIEQYGKEFGYPKLDNSAQGFFTKWSQELEDYCVRDVDITERVYRKYASVILDPAWAPSISLEQSFQSVVNTLHANGFSFNSDSAGLLESKVLLELRKLDTKIAEAFPPKETLIREFTPKATKFGTINQTSVPKALREKMHEYEVGTTYRHTHLVEFNPSSHKQLIDVLHDAGWSPVDKTKTHIDTEREVNRSKFRKKDERVVDLDILNGKLVKLAKYGWKINENNLSTLPSKAPEPSRLLAKRILLESRRRTLREWLDLVQDDGRIHGHFQGIGAWTHRMAHQRPNTANIPNEYDINGKKKLLGKEMRALWQAPANRLLVGVDAEGIQLRIFAHLIDDKEFTDALVNGRKEDKTDPHSLNQRILGDMCKSRSAAKRFIYALLLGAGMSKLASILECEVSTTKEALDRLLRRYGGFAHLKETIIPKDARRGFFVGLDDRKVPIPGDTESERRHLAMSGYLQCGEAVVMKKATLKWLERLKETTYLKDFLLVNFVHDEWQSETVNNMDIAIGIAQHQSESLRIVGEELGLKCPLAGSYWNEDHKDYTIGTNWAQTH
jgi:DNA polymerase-1